MKMKFLLLASIVILTACQGAPVVDPVVSPVVSPIVDPVVERPIDDPVMCTQQYDPVCAKKDVVCIKAPCPSLDQTYSNECMAKVDGAYDIKPGECL